MYNIKVSLLNGAQFYIHWTGVDPINASMNALHSMGLSVSDVESLFDVSKQRQLFSRENNMRGTLMRQAVLGDLVVDLHGWMSYEERSYELSDVSLSGYAVSIDSILSNDQGYYFESVLNQ